MVGGEVHQFAQQDRVDQRKADVDTGHTKRKYHQPFIGLEVFE
jgi:hypothetical protein